jgi:hypothetical protein
MRERFFGVGQRQQVVQHAATDAAPAQVPETSAGLAAPISARV